jgi:hypothetical protein
VNQVVFGRKKDYRNDGKVLINEYKWVAELLKERFSIRKVMTSTGKNNGTIQKIRAISLEQNNLTLQDSPLNKNWD